MWLELALAGEGLCRFVNVAYARRRHAVKRQQRNVIHGYQIGSDDAIDLKQCLINHMTRVRSMLSAWPMSLPTGPPLY